MIIDDLKIVNELSDNSSTNYFPEFIFIDLDLDSDNDIKRKRIYFARISEDQSHPILSDDIYLLDETSKDIKKYEIKIDQVV